MTEVTQSDILRALTELGIVKGDLVLFHSSLKSMGHVVGGADAVIDAFLEAVGEEGTVVVPTLSQTNFEHAYEDWTMDRPSDVGLITETFRKRPNALRSDQATHSVAAIGKLAHELTYEHTAYGPRYGIFGDTPFSHSSPWEKMYQHNAKIVFVGITMRKNTFKHLIEYRIVERYLGAIQDEEARSALKAKVWTHNRFGEKGIWPFHNAEQLQAVLEENGMVKKATCGDATFLCVNSKEMCDFADALFEREPEKWYTPEVLQWMEDCRKAAAKTK